MNKKGVIIGVIVIAIIAGVVASLSVPASETVNLDMGRTHGTISTAMGSPVLGDPSAPITIVEFG
ncbi:MAG: DsbA family protein, partial [Nitrosopumilus sp.]|nr:DsbA family protein [Nitrosopumilus sp.]